MLRSARLALLLFSIAGCTQPASQQAIECPVPETGQASGTVEESAAQIAAAGQQLHHGNSNAIGEVAAAVRKRHPEAGKGAIVNYLLTAYCPGLNADGALDQNGRRRAMSSFAKQAEATVR